MRNDLFRALVAQVESIDELENMQKVLKAAFESDRINCRKFLQFTFAIDDREDEIIGEMHCNHVLNNEKENEA